jgi:hypothetical protein
MGSTRRTLWILATFTLAGAIFAGSSVVRDFVAFYGYEGTLFKIANCVTPNPVIRPCFYGSLAFIAAFVWTLVILRASDVRRWLRWLTLFLVGAVLFALGNLFVEMYSFYLAPAGAAIGCSGAVIQSPFATPCFIGSTLFVASLITSLVALKFSRRTQ